MNHNYNYYNYVAVSVYAPAMLTVYEHFQTAQVCIKLSAIETIESSFTISIYTEDGTGIKQGCAKQSINYVIYMSWLANLVLGGQVLLLCNNHYEVNLITGVSALYF